MVMSQISQVTVSSRGFSPIQSSSNTDDTAGFLPLLATDAGEQPRTSVDNLKLEPNLRITDIPAPHSGCIRILELNKPSTRNAISRALLAELQKEIDAIQKQYDPDSGLEIASEDAGNKGCMKNNGPTRALIIASGVDSCFCSGADLKERKGFTAEETDEFLTILRGTFTALSQLPIPTISAIGSLALGGGFELALATHLRVVSSNATVGFPETRLGIIPGAGGTYRLSALIGISQARRLVLTGRRITGVEMYRLGIADHLVDVRPQDKGHLQSESDTLLEARLEVLVEAVKLAEEICEGGPVATRAAIQVFKGGPNEDTENAMYNRVMKTEDRNEALQAFAEKRKPVFRGR